VCVYVCVSVCVCACVCICVFVCACVCHIWHAIVGDERLEQAQVIGRVCVFVSVSVYVRMCIYTYWFSQYLLVLSIYIGSLNIYVE